VALVIGDGPEDHRGILAIEVADRDAQVALDRLLARSRGGGIAGELEVDRVTPPVEGVGRARTVDPGRLVLHLPGQGEVDIVPGRRRAHAGAGPLVVGDHLVPGEVLVEVAGEGGRGLLQRQALDAGV
jgi:hypothetical protein